MENNGGIWFQLRAENDKLKQDLQEAQNQIRGLSQNVQKESTMMQEAFRSVGGMIATAFTVQAATSFVQAVIKVRSEIQGLEIAFGTLLGSKAKADALMSEIKTYAGTTPMMMEDLAGGAKTLLGFNVAAEKVMPIMKQIGDISMGNSQRFQSLTLAFAQMTATGKLMGQDLLQMVNAGFNPLQEISKQTGKSMAELKDEMSKGAISVEMVENAFKKATDEGGMFHGMLKQQSKGLTGSISNLKGAINDMFNDIGENSEGIIAGTVEGLTGLVRNYKAVGEALGVLIGMYGAYKTAVIASNAIEKAGLVTTGLQSGATNILTVAKNALTAAQARLNAMMLANPAGVMIAIFAGLTYAVYKLITYETDAEKQTKRLNNAFEEMQASISKETRELDSLKKQLDETKKGTEAYNRVKEAMLAKADESVRKLAEEAFAVGDLNKAYELLKNGIESSAKAKARDKAISGIEKKYGEVLTERGGGLYDALKEINKNNLEKTKIDYDLILKDIEKNGDKKDKSLNQKVSSILAKGSDNGFNLNGFISDIKRAKRDRDELANKAAGMFGEATKPNKTAADKQVKGWKDYLEGFKKDNKDGLNRKELLRLAKEADTNDTKEALKKELEAAKNAFISDNDAQKEAKKAFVAELEQILKTKEDKKGKPKSTNKAEKDAISRQKQLDAIEEDKEAKLLAERQAALDIDKNTLELMEDSFDKKMALVALQHKQELLENDKRKLAMVKSIRDEEEKKASAKGQKYFNRLSITDKSLSDNQNDQLKSYQLNADKSLVQKQEALLNELKGGYLTYTEERIQIEKKYQKDLDALQHEDGTLREGVSVDNVENLKKQRDEALSEFDVQFASKEARFKGWMDAVAQMSVDKLKVVLNEAQDALSKAAKEGTDPNVLNEARAKVKVAKDSIEEKEAKMKTDPDKKSLKKWKELQTAIGKASKELNGFADGLDEANAQALKTTVMVAETAFSIIDNIDLVTNGAISGAERTAEASSSAIQKVEQASVILAIIGAALKIVTAIFDLFKEDESANKYAEDARKLNDELARTRRLSVLEDKGIFGPDMWQRAVKGIEVATEAMRRFNGVLEDNNAQAAKFPKEVFRIMAGAAAQAKDLDSMVGEMRVVTRTGSFWRRERTDSLKNVVPELFKDGKLDKDSLAAFAGSETFKRLSEQNQQYILQMKNDWEEYKKAMEVVDEYLSGVFGDLGNTISDALVDAFANGTDAAEAFSKSVSEMLEKLAKDMIYSVTLAPMIQKAQDEMQKIMGNTGMDDEAKFRAFTNVLGTMTDDAIKQQGLANGLLQKYQDIAKGKGFDIFQPDDSSREASSKGLAQASQDSVEELNGRMTVIQGHTYSLVENSTILVSNSAMMLNQLAGINQNTLQLHRLEAMEHNIDLMRSSLSNIEVKGVALK